MNERTTEFLDLLQRVAPDRAIPLAARYADQLDLAAVAFFNDDLASPRAMVISDGELLVCRDYSGPGSRVWKMEGRIREWTVHLHSRPSSIPGYLGGRLLAEELVPALYPPVEADTVVEIDHGGRLRFADSRRAIAYAESLHAVVSEHGIDGTVAVAVVLAGADEEGVLQKCLRTRPVRPHERRS